jgi:hypothetical protein
VGAHFYKKMTLNHIDLTMNSDQTVTTMTKDTTVAFVTLLVALLTSLPTMWHEETPSEFQCCPQSTAFQSHKESFFFSL